MKAWDLLCMNITGSILRLNNLPKVSIIIPFYNQDNIAAQVINAVLSLDYPLKKLEVIIVDDGSTDNTNNILSDLRSENIINVFHETNRGRAQARNSGIRRSSGDLIGFLDGDMVVENSWLSEIVQVLMDKNVFGCMGESVPPGDYADSAMEKYFHSYWRGARKHGANKPIPFKRFLFNNTVVRKEALAKAGFFDETFQGYGGEDTDLAIRFWRLYPHGLRYCPDARVFHHHQRSIRSFCDDMQYFGERNLPILISRYPHLKNILISGWMTSIPGRIFFNRVVGSIVRVLTQYSRLTILTRYLVVDAVLTGLKASGYRK